MRSPLSLWCSSIAVVLGVGACGPSYVYVPATNASAQVAGRPAADYPIPPEAPRGDVRIASFGFAELVAADNEDQKIRSLHLRMIVANDSDHPWTLETRQQRVELAGRGQSAPAFASADPGTPPPLVTIAPAGKRVVDLFFPLPADLQDADKIPAFDAVWRVDVGGRVVEQRTPFERLAVEAAPGPDPWDYGVGYPWGPPFWYDPLYPHVGFVGAVVPRFYVHGGVVIHHGPHVPRAVRVR